MAADNRNENRTHRKENVVTWWKRLALAAGIGAIVAVGGVATPAVAHTYSNCTTYFDLGTSYNNSLGVWESNIYTALSSSACSDVNVTHFKNGNFATLINAQVRCEIWPPGQSPYTGTYFNITSFHNIIEVCKGVPNGWGWSIHIKTAINEPGPMYFSVSY